MTRQLSRSEAIQLAFATVMVFWPLVYGNSYALSVMVLAGVFALLALGFTILVGQAGQISLGHAAFFGMGAYTAALLTTKFNTPPVLALMAGAVASGAIALVLGRPVLKLKGFILALVTMGLGEIFYVIVRQSRTLTGGLVGLSGIPWLGVGSFVLDDFMKQYYAIWGLVLITFLFSQRAIKARPGRALRALAISEATASTLGIYTSDWKLIAFVVSAIYAGFAGGLYAFVMSAIGPGDFVFVMSISVVIIVMLGGMGSLWGALTGSILMSWLTRSFTGYQEYSGLIYAVVLIFLVIFLPGGLAGGLRRDQLERLRRLLRIKDSGLSPQLVNFSHASVQAEAVVFDSERSEGSAPLMGEMPLVALGPGSSENLRAPRGRLLPDSGKSVASFTREPLLRLEGLCVSFGGLQAVNKVSLAVQEGTVHALIGPNGAGKTTLFNAMSGLQPLDAGRIQFNGQEITRRSAADIARMGMARTFQSLHVFPNMTVLENVMVGRHRHERAGFIVAGLGLPWQLREEQDSRGRSLRALELVGLQDKAGWPVIVLPYGQQRMVEIARALATEPRLLLLDEPAAGLNTTERIQLMDRVARIRHTGVTVLLVEHDMDMVMGISDTVSVLHYGSFIAEGTPDEVQKHPAVIEAYLGTGVQGTEVGVQGPVESVSPGCTQEGDVLLEVDGVSTYYGSVAAVRGISVRVHLGEIVAILGSNGAGKTTLLRTISGLERPRTGRILYQGRDITRLSRSDIVALGIAHVQEGRHIFPTLSVQDNLRLGAYLCRDKKKIQEDVEFVYQVFPILRDRRRQVAGTLSGGEQQMLAIGRALMGHPRLVLLDEPSMGLAPLVVDLIFETLVKLNQQGLTLLMVEQNAQMALSIAHHAVVLQTGTVALSGAAAELRLDDRVRGLYLGESEKSLIGKFAL